MTGTVTATFEGLTKGTVEFRTNTTDGVLRDPTGNVLWTGPKKVRIVAGAIEVDLPATDDAAYAETDWQWCASVKLDGRSSYLRWFELPDGTTVDLSSIAGELAPGDPLTHPIAYADVVADIQDPESVIGEALATAVEVQTLAVTPRTPVDPQHQRVILFGTSQELASTSGVEGVMSAASPTHTASGRGWANWSYAYLDHQFYTAVNAGIGGNRYDQMLARISTDVLAYDSEWVWMGGPINDITNARTFAQIKADLDAMLALLLADNRKVLILTAAASTSVDSAGERTVLADSNTYIKTLPDLFPGRVVVADIFADISDTGTVQPLANATFDGVHYSDVGAHLVGRRAAEAVRAVTPVPLHEQTTAPGRPALTQLATNPFLTSTGWTVTTATASWAVPGTVSLTYTGRSAANEVEGVALSTPLAPAAGYAAGDKVRLRAKAKWKRAVPLGIASQVGPQLLMQPRNIDNSFTDPQPDAWRTAGAETEIPDRFPMSGEVTLQTPWLLVGPNVDRLYCKAFFQGVASVWVEFSDFEILRKA